MSGMIQALIPLLAFCPPSATESVTIQNGLGTRWEQVLPESDVYNDQTRIVDWALPRDPRRVSVLWCTSRATGQRSVVPIPSVTYRCRAVLYRTGSAWKLDRVSCI